jgi:hypothetical protein
LALQSCLPLCFCLQETTEHILTKCNYAEALWNSIAGDFNLPGFDLLNQWGRPVDWVHHLVQNNSKKDRRKALGILFTFWWQLWKEKNRRVFDNYECSIPRLSALLKEDILLYCRVLSPALPA